MAKHANHTKSKTLRNMVSNHIDGLSFGQRIDLLLRIVLMVVVVIGCYLVLEPFLTSILIAAVLAVVTWPLFTRLRTSLMGASTLSAMIMLLAIIVTILIPVTLISVTLAQEVPRNLTLIVQWLKNPAPILESIRTLPYVGNWLYTELNNLIDPATFGHTVQQMIEPVTTVVVNGAVNVGVAIFQLLLVTFIVFFFYRDGPWFAQKSQELIERLSGKIAQDIVQILVNTTRSVVFGIIGTAIAQGVVAGIGFWIAGVPGVLFLSCTVCLLSVVPIGPPLVWLPAAIWLYFHNEVGLAIFLVLWGSLAVSSVDNFLKPILISRGTSLPLSLIFLGVFGGVMAFGFLGLILGPLLLAIGIALIKAWMRSPVLTMAQMSEVATTHVPATTALQNEDCAPPSSVSSTTPHRALKPDAESSGQSAYQSVTDITNYEEFQAQRQQH